MQPADDVLTWNGADVCCSRIPRIAETIQGQTGMGTRNYAWFRAWRQCCLSQPLLWLLVCFS